MSAAGWNASGRGRPAWGGRDSRLEAGTAGQARAMPHFTVVPVDGPRRGDYDNLEGLSWVDYGERAEREDSDGEGAPGGGCGRDGGRLHETRAPSDGARRRPCGTPLFLLPARSVRRVLLVRDSRARSSSTQPQLLPRGPRAGACRRGRLGRPASGLPHSGWCRTRLRSGSNGSLNCSSLTFCESPPSS